MSKTPLRDALIQLETEDFVTILPRRGEIVKKLPFHEIKCYYKIFGAASIIKDEHWNFEYHPKYLRKFYTL